MLCFTPVLIVRFISFGNIVTGLCVCVPVWTEFCEEQPRKKFLWVWYLTDCDQGDSSHF